MSKNEGAEEALVSRQSQILEMVMDAERVEVAELADRLGVSSVTIRKDLDQLVERGLIRREHGYAVIASPDDLTSHLAYHYDTKVRIARSAAETVADGSTIMIESGSVCALLAEELCRVDRGITIVTNSAFIAGFVRNLPGAHLILLGGQYQNQSQCLVGPLARAGAAQFFVDTVFVGCDGFVPGVGFTGKDHPRAEIVREMARQADRTVVLTESAKFTRRGAVALLSAHAVSAVHTDDALPEDTATELAEAGASVHTVARQAGKPAA